MELVDLFLVALMPVLKVLVVTAVGLLLAMDRVDLLGAVARNNLNNVLYSATLDSVTFVLALHYLYIYQNISVMLVSWFNCISLDNVSFVSFLFKQLVFYVFSPSLISSNLADTITLKSLGTLWFMPVNIFLSCMFGSILGWILTKVTKIPQHLHALVIGCSSAGNLGNLLLIILPALCEESGSPFAESSSCSTNAEAYASLSMAVLAIYVWSYVYIIMRVSASKTINKSSSSSLMITDTSSNEPSDTSQLSYAAEPLLPSVNSPNVIPTHLSNTRIQDKFKESFLNAKQGLQKLAIKMNLKMVFAPSIVAAIVGFIIGIVKPLRKMVIGDSAPLRVIYNSSYLIGEAAIPCITLIIGANLFRGIKGTGPGLSALLGIIAIRFIVLPPIGILVVKSVYRFGIVRSSDSLYQFALMLQYAVPPAMNIGTISQLVKSGETECSVVMLWTYGVASIFLTLWSTLFIYLVS